MARALKPLEAYRKKRDFVASPEPAGLTKSPRQQRRTLAGGVFVVQEHHASHHHYDFRLEMNGVLKSWAVPKGPSLDPAEKRLAVEVEDHPLEYGDFEGTIPKGQYGGGSVLLWDRGRWSPSADGPEAQASYRAGKLKFTLHGTKLQGSWALVRMKNRESNGRSNWLLMKESDRYARVGSDVTHALPRSVASNKRIEDIGAGSRVWDARHRSNGQSHGEVSTAKARGQASKKDRPQAPRRSRASASPSPRAPAESSAASLNGARRAPLPRTLSPQLATPADHVPTGSDWYYEVKFDGYRLLARVESGSVQLLTRSGKDWSKRFPTVRRAVEGLGLRDGFLDGEVVALNKAGVSEFGLLQATVRDEASERLSYYVFDIPYYDGHDLTECPLKARRTLLGRLLVDTGPTGIVRLSETIEGGGENVVHHACRLGLEGIVAKRADSVYSNERTPAWLKVRCSNRQELVIAGFTEPRNSRPGFGALLLGYFDPDGGLMYAGKVGTGFDHAGLVGLARKLKGLERDEPAFEHPPRGVEARGAHWIEPKLVAEIEFTEWTADGRLRHPVFIGLRQDKNASEVVRESKSTRMTRGQRSARPTRSRVISPRSSGRATAPATSGAAMEVEAARVAGVTITHPDRVVFTHSPVTKLDLARYYAEVAPWIMAHAEERPLSLYRCPAGAGGQCFFQKHPDFENAVGLKAVPVTESKGPTTYATITTAAGFAYLVQMNTLEFHAWGSRADRIEKPDRLVFDLDPGEDVAWPQVVEAARLIRERLLDFNLVSFVKTTGGKGLHVVVPIRRGPTWTTVKEWARARADEFAAAAPDRFVATMSKERRRGKVFIDYLRNQRGGTSVLPYSSRARRGATVSMPVEWDGLETLTPDAFRVDSALQHVAKRRRDPWNEFWKVRQSLGHHDAIGTRPRDHPHNRKRVRPK